MGSDLAKLVPGRVSTEVDARLAYDTHAIIRKVFDMFHDYLLCSNSITLLNYTLVVPVLLSQVPIIGLVISKDYIVLIKLSILVMNKSYKQFRFWLQL